MDKHLTLKRYLFSVPNDRAVCAAQKVVLEDIYLIESKIWRKPGLIPEVLTLKNKCSSEIIHLKEYRNRLDIYSTLCKFGVTAFAPKSPNKPLMKIEASFCTSFSYDLDDIDFKDFRTINREEEDFGLFDDLAIYLIEITPISNAWPYWRELAQDLSSRMGFIALRVPLLKIVPVETDNDFDGLE
jgi:hypothetical protein